MRKRWRMWGCWRLKSSTSRLRFQRCRTSFRTKKRTWCSTSEIKCRQPCQFYYSIQSFRHLIWSSFCACSCIVAQTPVLTFYRLLLEGDKEEKEEFVLKLKEEVEELRKTLRWQAEINGISMKSCKIKTLQSSKIPHVSVSARSQVDYSFKIYIILQLFTPPSPNPTPLHTAYSCNMSLCARWQ